MTVLEMGIRGSAVIGAVLLARLLLRRAPAAARFALWALVAVALLVPVRLKTDLSLMPAQAVRQSESTLQTAPADPTDREQLRLRQGLILEGDRTYVMTTPAPETTGTATAKQTVAWIWVGGALAMLLWAAVSWLRLRPRIRVAVRLRENVYLCDHIPSPFVLGLFRPKIYLPSDLSEAHRDQVLAHERGHIFRGDHLTRLLGWGILCLYWWHPLVWLSYILFCRDTEMACDEWVIRGLEKAEVRNYSEALIACSLPRRSLGIHLAFGEVGLKARIKNIVHYRKPALWISLVAAVLAVVVAVCFLTERPPEKAVPEATEPSVSWEDIRAEAMEKAETDIAPENPDLEPPLELTGALSAEGARALADFRDGTGYQFFNQEAEELVRLLNALTAEDFLYEPQLSPVLAVTLTASGRDVYMESDTDLVVLVHDGIRWGIRDEELSHFFRILYTVTDYEEYNVAPLGELRDNYSIEEAMIDLCVVEVDGQLRYNQLVWEDFCEKSLEGQPATVRLYHSGEGGKCVYDLSFDGSYYTLCWYEGDKLCTEQWQHLHRFSGRDGQYGYDHYILTDDPDCTWDEGSHTLHHSTGHHGGHHGGSDHRVCSLYTYYPDNPTLPGTPVKAELVLEGQVILATTVPESLARLEVFFREAEETYEPKTYNPGPELVLSFSEGESVTAVLDLNYDLMILGGAFYDYGPGYTEEGSYNALPEMLACFSITEWPQPVLDKYGDYIWW